MKTIREVLANSKELYDPIFVVGCPRSGTGVLARTIGLSEPVCYLGETRLITHYYTREIPIYLAIYYKRRNGEALVPIIKGKVRKLFDTNGTNALLRRIIGDMIRYTKLTCYDVKPSRPLVDRYGVGLTSEDVELVDLLGDKYSQVNGKHIDKMLRIMFKDVQLLSQRPRVLEKTPHHALFIPTLQRIFPEAKVCHIVRNARDVAASYMLNYGQEKVDRRSIRYICEIHRRIVMIDEAYRKSNNSKYYSMRYEEFISEPVRSIENVFRFLELPLSRSVIEAVKEVKPMASNWCKLPERAQRYVEAWLGMRE